MLRLTVNYSANRSIINVRKNCSCNARCCSCSTRYHDIPSNGSSPSWISIALKLIFFSYLGRFKNVYSYQIPAWSKTECNALSWDFTKFFVNKTNWTQNWTFFNIFIQLFNLVEVLPGDPLWNKDQFDRLYFSESFVNQKLFLFLKIFQF